jgi:diadenosine tetraphosphatase ApaH/serine/threonine PP2A family protein phosphatase
LRLLILSDIHANIDALEACLEAAPQCDSVANLGDVVGYGAAPNEVVDRVRGLGDIFVRGNHDRAAAGLVELTEFNHMAAMAAAWTQRTLTPENLEWVREIPRGPIIDGCCDGVQFVHGSPFDEDEYILSSPTAEIILEGSLFPRTFFGHTHVAGGYAKRGREVFLVEPPKSEKTELASERVVLESDVRYLINPGSVGQPRDGDPRAGFATYEPEENAVTFYRVPYDIDKAQQRILRAGLPERLAKRLADGR